MSFSKRYLYYTWVQWAFSKNTGIKWAFSKRYLYYTRVQWACSKKYLYYGKIKWAFPKGTYITLEFNELFHKCTYIIIVIRESTYLTLELKEILRKKITKSKSSKFDLFIKKVLIVHMFIWGYLRKYLWYTRVEGGSFKKVSSFIRPKLHSVLIVFKIIRKGTQAPVYFQKGTQVTLELKQ